MIINAVAPHSQVFQARIKMPKPNLEVLAKAAIGTSALAAGAATVAEGAFSFNAIGDNAYSIESIPKEVVDSHKGFLTSAGHKYDAAGEMDGIPVQSTIAPLTLSLGGISVTNLSSNAFKNAFGEDNLKATTVMPITLSANKSAQKSMLGAGYIGTAAASIYSGMNGDTINQVLPEAIKSKEYDLEGFEQISLVSGGVSASVPVAAGFSKLSSMTSDTKSGKFVSNTLSSPNNTKKIPS